MQEAGVNVKMLDIVSVTKMRQNMVQERKIFILSEIVDIIYTDVTEKIGEPKDFATNTKRNRFPYEETDVSIPKDAVYVKDGIKDGIEDGETDGQGENPFRSGNSIHES